MVKKIVDAVVHATNESAKNMGLKIDKIEDISAAEAENLDHIKKKLKETEAILNALLDAQRQEKAVVKSYGGRIIFSSANPNFVETSC